MALDPGFRLGPYEVIAALGAGGMAEVYKARDTRLARTVEMASRWERALLSFVEPQHDERPDSCGNAFNAGVPKALFATRVPLSANPYRTNYAVTGNGQRFLVNARVDEAPLPITVVLNWPTLLNRTEASKRVLRSEPLLINPEPAIGEAF